MADLTDPDSDSPVLDWLAVELTYASEKWPDDEEQSRVAFGSCDQLIEDVSMYMHRAKVLGLKNPLGRQALAKALMTLFRYTEATVQVHGGLPPAGVPSGQLGNWPGQA